jgi:hypothetical protein
MKTHLVKKKWKQKFVSSSFSFNLKMAKYIHLLKKKKKKLINNDKEKKLVTKK